LQSFSYFVELYTSRYEKLDGDAYGMLVISERSRCDSEWFVLSYDNNLEYDPATESTYWRNCERRRDPGFDADDNTVGFDFAQYSCDSRTASCPELPPAHAEYDAYEGWGPDDPPIRDHGLCELAMEDAAPADGLWRGMNHHSQFKCVRIIQANEEPDAVHKKRPDEFGLNAAYTFNSCTVQDCGSTADCVQSQTVSDDPIEAKYPVFECTATDEMPAVGAVGWAAVNYSPYGHATAGETEDGQPILIPATDTYNGGCINEDAQWEYLCPYPEYGWETEPPLDAYGRYHCYCWEGMFLWAPDDTVGVCNEPCPDAGVCIECETPGVADCSPLQCDWSGNAGYNPRSALIWSADGVDAGVNGSVWAPDEPDMSACEE
jgi:hypothetical protein